MSNEVQNSQNGISTESSVPLYFQLITLIKRQIHSGILKQGDLVPSEHQLCSQYGVSRSTVRQALAQLTEERLIIRRRGKGSFIASEKLNRNLNHLYSFTEDMISLGLNPYSKVVEKKIVSASNDIAKALDIMSENMSVLQLTRLRFANDEPLLIETTYIPLYLCPDIMNEDFSSKSLYDIFRTKYHLDLFRAVETFEAIKLNKETATLLKCSANSTAFNIHRTAYLDSGIAFEYTSSIARSDKCKFKVELFATKNKVNFSRKINI